jgi:hypothetical protein
MDGQPGGAVYDGEGELYMTDLASAAVLMIDAHGNKETLVDVYEDRSLKVVWHSVFAHTYTWTHVLVLTHVFRLSRA